MVRSLLLVLASALFALPCYGFFEHAGDKDLGELRKMKGVFIAIHEGESAELLFNRTNNENLVGFTIGWLGENDLPGKGFVEKSKAEVPTLRGGQGPSLTAVELYGTDATGRTVFVTPLFFKEASGGELAPQIGGTQHTRIQFSIDKSLIEHSFIRFYEYIGIHAKQWTDVYLGRKPAPRKLMSGAASFCSLSKPRANRERGHKLPYVHGQTLQCRSWMDQIEWHGAPPRGSGYCAFRTRASSGSVTLSRPVSMRPA